MSFPKYETYKDSGVEWLGDVPAHWRVERNLGVFDERKECNQPDKELLSVTVGRGIIRQSEITIKKDSSNEDKSKYKVVQIGDLAYNKMRAWQGAVGISAYDGIVSPAYVVVTPRNPKLSKYFHYLYRNQIFITEANRLSYGLCDDMNSLRYEHFKGSYSPIPPDDELDRIVAFLDTKTTEIDALIAKKERQIQLLDEQKAIRINQAVTRGLNPDLSAEASAKEGVKLKPSGIEWIGDIPEHWEVKAAKHLCQCIIDCKNRTPEVIPDGEYFVLRTSNVKNGLLVDDEITKTDFKHFTVWTERGAPQKDDVLFTREAPAGEACLFDGKIQACLGQRMMYFRTDKTKLLPQFLIHSIYEGPSAKYIFLKTNGSTVGHLRLPQVYALPILHPPVKEQVEILAQIAKTEEIEKTLIKTVKSQIQSLKTLRSTLIAHAVTGKIKV